MIIKNVNLETVCGITSKLPESTLPEIAFAGKSNVGKSSLINALMNRKALARTSAQPGKTQTINFYNINDAMYLVDLPGYGYAKVMVPESFGRYFCSLISVMSLLLMINACMNGLFTMAMILLSLLQNWIRSTEVRYRSI